jgi:hypothetical protein
MKTLRYVPVRSVILLLTLAAASSAAAEAEKTTPKTPAAATAVSGKKAENNAGNASGKLKARKGTPKLGATPGPVYDTAEAIRAMPRCKGVVVERRPCYVYLKTAGGNEFYIGSPGSKADVGRFLDELKDGRSYKFPGAFLKYEKRRAQAGQPRPTGTSQPQP